MTLGRHLSGWVKRSTVQDSYTTADLATLFRHFEKQLEPGVDTEKYIDLITKSLDGCSAR